MGKKDKKKKKVSGIEKTAMKTEKKLNSKQKKELAARGEDDIEKVIAEIEKEEAKKQRVVESQVSLPSRRVNFTLTPHPLKDELIMYGGEFYDGKKTVVYGDLFFYNINKNEWTVVKAPGAPPPRCGHQAVTVASNKGELWIFGGEFTSPSESQFYHYRDLWVYHIGDKKWEKINAPGGPSSRSGHRMVVIKKCLYIFGGFYDNLRDCKYFNDIHCFNMSTYTWNKLVISGIPPAPRSGCVVLPTSENKILVYGGYRKEKIKKDVDKGQVHTDMFLFSPEKNDETGLKWKWTLVKQRGAVISPRCSTAATLVQPNVAFMFGGVYDEEDNEEEINGTFYNDLVSLDTNNHQWHYVKLCGKNDLEARKKRRKAKGDENDSDDKDDDLSEEIKQSTVITDDDGIFTVTLGPSTKKESSSEQPMETNSEKMPSARINPGLAVKNNTLFMFGGIVEGSDKQYTLCDFYKLDIKKLDEWVTIHEDDLSSQKWLYSSDSESGSDEDSDASDSESDSDKLEDMDVDE